MILDPCPNLKANIYLINKVELGVHKETAFTAMLKPYITNEIFDNKFNATSFIITSLRLYAKAYDYDILFLILNNKGIFEHTGLYQIALDFTRYT